MIINYCEREGVRQAGLARQAGVKRSTVHHWVTGRRFPRYKRVLEIVLRTVSGDNYKEEMIIFEKIGRTR